METELLVVVGSILVQAIGIYTQQNMTKYKIEQLEAKVHKHNNIVERTYVLEGKMKATEEDIHELKGQFR